MEEDKKIEQVESDESLDEVEEEIDEAEEETNEDEDTENSVLKS